MKVELSVEELEAVTTVARRPIVRPASLVTLGSSKEAEVVKALQSTETKKADDDGFEDMTNEEACEYRMTKRHLLPIKFLFEQYEPRCYYWEVGVAVSGSLTTALGQETGMMRSRSLIGYFAWYRAGG